MTRLIVLFITALFFSTGAQSSAWFASFALESSDSDALKDERFSGDTTEGTGQSLTVRVIPSFLQPGGSSSSSASAGRRPEQSFEIEAGHLQQGDLDFDGLFLGTPDTGTIEIDGTFIGLVYNRRFSENVDVFARYGSFSWDVDEEEVFGGIPESSDASGSSSYYGFGARYWVMPQLGVRVGWSRYNDVGETDETGRGDIKNMSIGVDYAF